MNCYNPTDSGILATKNIIYFPSMLGFQCFTNISFDFLSSELSSQPGVNSTLVQIGLSTVPGTLNATEYNCCDYYQDGKGYVFSECDNGVGIVTLTGKNGTAIDLEFKDMNQTVNETILML